MIDYHCPDCLGRLLKEETKLLCKKCGLSFEHGGNTTFFLSSERAAPLASLASAESHPETWGLTADRSCADWRFFIPFGKDVSILECGAGKGEISFLLARNAGEVHAVAFSKSAARVAAQRALDKGLKNVRFLAVEPGRRLPFSEESFDAVVADRVLNYPCLFSASAGVKKSASFLLSEAFRVLKKGGILYIGVENVFYGIPLVRKAASLFRQSKVVEDLNFLFNLKAAGIEKAGVKRLAFLGYKKLIESANFHSIRAFAPLPDPMRPKATLPLEIRTIQKYFFLNLIRQNNLTMKLASRLGALLVSAGLFPYAVPYYYFIAEK